MARCERHDVALAPDGTCILCRRDVPPPSAGPSLRRPVGLLIVLGLVVALAALIWWRRFPASDPSVASAQAHWAGASGRLNATNSAGRTGSYYLPSGYESRPLPLLVALHGSGASGAAMVNVFAGSAERVGFVIVAPDSRVGPNGEPNWEVPNHPRETTDDADHIRACVDEVRAMPGVRIDETRTLVAGHSGGGSTAPYMASTDALYTAFAVLHGGAFPGGLGPRRVRGWFSTGDTDPFRPAARVSGDAAAVRAAGFSDVTFRTFHEAHSVGDEELAELLRWWLGSGAHPQP